MRLHGSTNEKVTICERTVPILEQCKSFNWCGANCPTWTERNSDAKSWGRGWGVGGGEHVTVEPPLGSSSIIRGSD